MINVNWDEIPLGLISDIEIAKKYNISSSTVNHQRNKRNISKYSNKPEIDWEKYRTLSDVKIAKIYKCRFHHVAKSRKEHNILDCRTERLRDIDWTKSTRELCVELKMTRQTINYHKRKLGFNKYNNLNSIDWLKQPLGKVPDRVIAEKLNVSLFVVEKNRRRLNIKSYRVHKINIDWSKQPLGKIPDGQIAEKLNVSRSFISKNRTRLGIKPIREIKKYNIDWSKVPLGKEKDSVLARKLNVPYMTIRHHRISKGIPTYNSSIDWDKVSLGKKTDAEIARKYNISEYAVWYQRSKKGIPKYKIRKKK